MTNHYLVEGRHFQNQFWAQVFASHMAADSRRDIAVYETGLPGIFNEVQTLICLEKPDHFKELQTDG